jgi:hypothetical protein
LAVLPSTTPFSSTVVTVSRPSNAISTFSPGRAASASKVRA